LGKLDLAILKAGMDVGISDRILGSVDLDVYRGASRAVADRIADTFKRWGIDLALPRRKAADRYRN